MLDLLSYPRLWDYGRYIEISQLYGRMIWLDMAHSQREFSVVFLYGGILLALCNKSYRSVDLSPNKAYNYGNCALC